MPVAGDGPTTGKKRCHLAWFHRAHVRTSTHKTGEGPQLVLIAFKTLAQAFPEGDVLSNPL
jgi:glycine/serine hydroxymethyltransferase